MKQKKKFGQKIFTVHTTGTSRMVIIPKEFVDMHNIQKGDPVEVLFDDVLQYKPLKKFDESKIRKVIEKRAKKIKEEIKE